MITTQKLLKPHQDHAPEPWLASPIYSAIISPQATPGENRAPELTSYGGYLLAEGFSKTNRRRVLACVNALAGIPTEVLESIYSGSEPWATRFTLERLSEVCGEQSKKIIVGEA